MSRVSRKRTIGLLVACLWLGGFELGAEEPLLQSAKFDRSQTYYLHVPANYTADQAWPLFIAVHGGMASGLGDFKLWRQYADQEGFILLAPN